MIMNVELTNAEIRDLIVREVSRQLGDRELNPADVVIEVRSKQNYRDTQWEKGEFRATYKGEVK